MFCVAADVSFAGVESGFVCSLLLLFFFWNLHAFFFYPEVGDIFSYCSVVFCVSK